MQTREKILKPTLQADIKSRCDVLEKDSAQYGDAFVQLGVTLSELTDELTQIQEDDQEKLTEWQAKLAQYDDNLAKEKANIEAANKEKIEKEKRQVANASPIAEEKKEEIPEDSPPDSPNDLSSNDELNEVCAQLDKKYETTFAIYLALSTIADASASDRLLIPAMKQSTEDMKAKLTRVTNTLNKLIELSNDENLDEEKAEQMQRQAVIARQFTSKTAELLKKAEIVEKKIALAEKPQTEFGYFSNPLNETDIAEFLPPADAQKKMMDYLSETQGQDSFKFDVQSEQGDELGGRSLSKVKAPSPDLQTIARFIPSSITNDKHHVVRYAMLQEYDPAKKNVYLTHQDERIP